MTNDSIKEAMREFIEKLDDLVKNSKHCGEKPFSAYFNDSHPIYYGEVVECFKSAFKQIRKDACEKGYNEGHNIHEDLRVEAHEKARKDAVRGLRMEKESILKWDIKVGDYESKEGYNRAVTKLNKKIDQIINNHKESNEKR